MSTFRQVNKQCQGSYDFWMPWSFLNASECFRSNMIYESKSGNLKSVAISLVKNFLVKINHSNVCKITNLEWKSLMSLQEGKEILKWYGFSVGHENCKRNFYVESLELLQAWVSFLSPICVLTTFDEDFKVLKKNFDNQTSDLFFLVANTLNRKEYSVKSISRLNLDDDQIKSNNLLIREIKIMRKIDHPNIVKLHFVYESPTHIYLVFDNLEGETLFSRILSKKNLEEKTVANFAIRLLDTLKYLSDINVAHRGIKLENILMTSKSNDYDFKLIDFELATESNENPQIECGSPGYVAPEILRRLDFSPKVDVFSAGVVFYILLCGKMPFYGRNLAEILRKNRNCIVSFNHKIWKSISKNAINFILKLTDSNSNSRPSANDALNDRWLQQQIDNRPINLVKFS